MFITFYHIRKLFAICSYYADGGNIDLDVRDLTTRFTNDVIASTAFSLEINSLEEKDNYFYGQAAFLSGQSLWMNLKFAGFRLFPGLMKVFKKKY